MSIGTWVIISAMAAAIVLLALKIHSLHRALDEITFELSDRLVTDTNTQIGISSGDRHVRRLAARLNRELGKLREMRHRYSNGDRELKHALTNISHDLRTPLTAIHGYLELLEKEPLSEDGARYTRIIGERAEFLHRLTDELLDYSVILSDERHDKVEVICVNAVPEESLAAFYAAFTERGIVVHANLTEERVMRTLERAALARVFANILSNALKYGDGELEVGMSSECEIVFSNRAPGLDEVTVGRLFDRFYTVEAASGSTGLGLSIARTLVTQMNGRIDAEYEGGRLYIRIKL